VGSSRSLKTPVAAVVAMLAAATPVAAQQPVRETVVVTAAATAVPLANVTRAVTVITREQLAQLPVRTVADALRLVASVDVRARGPRGIQTDFAIRGANFGQTLVLVDGVRINDAQSGHHNGDIPVPLDAVERIEVLHGPGSSLFGADAFGGTINVITRSDRTPATAAVEAGSFGFVGGRGQTSFESQGIRHTVTGIVERSSGFMFARDFETAGISARTTVSDRTGLFAGYVWKDFGANGFYGPSPSHEWTDQTLVAVNHRFTDWSGWRLDGLASYRTHGDRFLWDVRRPGVSENRHRTQATVASLKASRGVGRGRSVAAGVEGGADWIRSNNLGDHSIARVSAFGEWRQAVGAAANLDAGLRLDRYSEFGTAWSPSIGVGWWMSSRTRLRASAGRAFRVPTFTERYYSDPANWARPEVGAETAWAGESGIDLFVTNAWMIAGTMFGRFDQDVIDWLRPSTAERWRTYNIRDVNTLGVEFSVRRTIVDGIFVQAQYTGLDVRAADVTQLSKYVLDFVPHTVTVTTAVPLFEGIRLAPRVEYKRRNRTTGSNEYVLHEYVLLDARVSRLFGPYEVQVEGTNLFNAAYQEILGVAMPGRALTVSISATRR
jgi:iron complex outermembrane receptor protein